MDLPWGPVQSCLGSHNPFANPNCRPTHSIYPNSTKKGRKLQFSPLGVVPTLTASLQVPALALLQPCIPPLLPKPPHQLKHLLSADL